MKIGFIGSHSSGKTTLVWQLAAWLKLQGYQDVAIVSEIARECDLVKNKDTTFDSQFWILMNQIDRERRLRDHEILLTDRTVIDNLAYSAWALLKTEKITRWEYTFMEKVARAWSMLYPYKIVFFLEPLKLQKDSQRDLDPKYQRFIYRKIKDLSTLFEPNVVYFKGTKEDRFEDMKEEMLRLLKDKV